LNIDEVDDIEETWKKIGGIINEGKINLISDVETIKKTISIVKDLYIILDHTRYSNNNFQNYFDDNFRRISTIKCRRRRQRQKHSKKSIRHPEETRLVEETPNGKCQLIPSKDY
jgi:hypothetical protein